MTRRALIVHAHPEPASFSAAQARVAAERLAAAGFEVARIDLYASGWNPVLSGEDFTDPVSPLKPQAEQLRAFREGNVVADVQRDLEQVLAADLLVLSFPLWWFSLPAIMKGWVDRVFTMGATFGGEHGLFDEAAMAGKHAILLTTTGSSQPDFTSEGLLGAMDDFLFHIRRGMLEFVGYTPLPSVITHGPARMDASDRQAVLDRVAASFDAVATAVVSDMSLAN